MRIVIDLDSLQPIQPTGIRSVIDSITVKRQTTEPLEFQFARNGVIQELSVGTVLEFGVKDVGEFDALDYVVFTDAFTKTGTGSTTVYTAYPSWDTEGIDDALGIDDGTENDVQTAEFMWDLKWSVGSTVQRSRISTVYVENNVTRDETLPVDPNPAAPSRFDKLVWNRYEITGLTGGGTNLDGVATANNVLASGHVSMLYLSGELIPYRLRAGTDAESSPSIIRPDDYDGSTNARVWEKIAPPHEVFLDKIAIPSGQDYVDVTGLGVTPTVVMQGAPIKPAAGSDALIPNGVSTIVSGGFRLHYTTTAPSSGYFATYFYK